MLAIGAQHPANTRGKHRGPRAIASVALCVGGLVLARAVANEDLSVGILDTYRDRAERELGA